MTAARRFPTVGRAAAFWLVAYAFGALNIGTTLPTPLYPLYEHRFGIAPSVITVIFATYGVGVIAALLVVGRMSDEVGRRPVLLSGLLFLAASMAVFIVAQSPAALYVGRFLSGVAAGIFTGTATAAILDLAPGDRHAFATAVAVASNVFGLAGGPLAAGLLAEWAPDPVQLPYTVEMALLLPAFAGVLLAPETVRDRRPPRLRLQRLRVPASVRGVFWQAAIAGFCGFAVSGLFGAVAPTFMAQLLGIRSHAVAGIVVFLLFAVSATSQIATTRIHWRTGLTAGCAVLAVAVALLAVALRVESLGLLIAASVTGGIGQGLAIGSGLAAVNARVEPEERGEVASTYFVVLFVGLILPIVGDGLLSDAMGLRGAGMAFSAIVGATVLAILLSLRLRRTVDA